MTITPSEAATAKLIELIESDDTIPQASRVALLSDLTAPEPDGLVAFKRALSDGSWQ